MPKVQGKIVAQKPTFGQLLNKYSKAAQQDRPLKKRSWSPSRRDGLQLGKGPTSAKVMSLPCSHPKKHMLLCHGCLRHQMLQIRCGNTKESRCNASQCHIHHIIKGKAPERRCMTDWAPANLVSSNMLNRSDRSSLTGQIGLSRDRPSLILQGRNIVSRRGRRMCSPCKWSLGRPPPMML